jgi:1-acyl-sn-glycerol-3-phosphate acyltransferase
VRPPRDAVWVWKDLHIFTTMVRPLFCRFHCDGRDNVPAQGGCIITCNHVMGPDFIVIAYASPRQVKFMAKQELFEKNRILTWLFDTCGTFAIRRGDTDLAAIEHAINLVKAGDVLGMFPEGTRSRTGKLQRGRSGAARIAILAQAPVVPAVVINAEPIFKPKNWASLKPRAAVTVRFGEPLMPPTDPNDSRALRAYTRQIMETMNNLLPEERRGELARRTAQAEADGAGVTAREEVSV